MGKIRTLVTVAAALMLAGCSGPGGPRPPPATTITASDKNVVQAVARANVLISAPPDQPSNPHGGHAVELGFTSGSGSSSQTIGSNYIAFADQRFDAPATLSYDFKLTYIDAAYRFRLLGDMGSLGVEILAGVADATIDFAVSSVGRTARQSISSVGVQAGLGAIYRPRTGTSLHLRHVWFYSGQEDGVTDATRLDLYVQQAIWKHATLRAGYAWWSLASERGETVSPIKVELRGPALGLELMF